MNVQLSSSLAARLLLTARENVRARMLGDLPGHEFHGNQWTTGSGGTITDQDRKVITGDWAWPNSSPSGMSYERLRNPKTDEGRQMTAILEKLPVHDGVTYRGVALSDPKDFEKLVSAKGYELELHSSASTDFDVAHMFADAQSAGGVSSYKPVILEMHGRGRDIAAHLPEDLQDTKEIVMMAGTRYKFTSLRHETSGGISYTRIVLKERR